MLALEAGAWQQAQHAFERALATEETPEALEGLGLAAWWLDLADVVFDSRERAYRGYRSRGDRAFGGPRRGLDRLGQLPRSAAKKASPTAGSSARAGCSTGSPIRPSTRFSPRAPRSSPCWTTAIPKRREALAAEAIRVGQAIGAIDYEMVGRALHGFALVTTGRVAGGTARARRGQRGDPRRRADAIAC